MRVNWMFFIFLGINFHTRGMHSVPAGIDSITGLMSPSSPTNAWKVVLEGDLTEIESEQLWIDMDAQSIPESIRGQLVVKSKKNLSSPAPDSCLPCVERSISRDGEPATPLSQGTTRDHDLTSIPQEIIVQSPVQRSSLGKTSRKEMVSQLKVGDYAASLVGRAMLYDLVRRNEWAEEYPTFAYGCTAVAVDWALAAKKGELDIEQAGIIATREIMLGALLKLWHQGIEYMPQKVQEHVSWVNEQVIELKKYTVGEVVLDVLPRMVLDMAIQACIQNRESSG